MRCNMAPRMTTIRDARPDDYPTFVELFAELGVPEPPPPREEFVSRILQSVFFVCDDAERSIGYGLGSVVGENWHVGHVVTAKDARARGVGRAIMDEHARRGRTAGRSRWTLNVKRENAPAIRLYERCGMAIAAKTWAMSIDWADVARLAASPRHDLIVVEPEADAAIERTFGLAPGEVGAHRARAGRVIAGVRADGRIVAFASFDPSFPGAAPFRPLEPQWLEALLASMKQHARPQDAHVRMIVEGDETLVHTLIDAGARVALELFRMVGSLA